MSTFFESPFDGSTDAATTHENTGSDNTDNEPAVVEAPDGEPEDPVGLNKRPALVVDQPPDRASLAAGGLLRRAMLEQGVTVGERDLVIIEVASVEWVNPATQAAPAILLGPEAADGHPGASGQRQGGNLRLAVYRCDEAGARQWQNQIAAQIAADLRTGRIVIAVTHDPTTLAAPVLGAADHHLVLPAWDRESFVAFLEEATGTPVTGPVPDPGYEKLLPDILRLATRKGQSADDYGRRIALLAPPSGDSRARRTLTLDTLHGMPELVRWGRMLASDIRDYKAGHLPWDECDRGALLYGPPGTGKTTAARALAEFCGVPFFVTSYADWQAQGKGHLGDVMAAIRSVFRKACENVPAILFIDELDSVNSRDQRDQHSSWWRTIINGLLEELDGTVSRDGLVVIGATNDPEAIDPAIRRAGRLDREIEIPLPNQHALAGIYRCYLGDALTPAEVSRLAALSIGKTGADVELLARGARRRARQQRRTVMFDDLLGEITGDPPDTGDPGVRRAATHEAGHAVAMLVHDHDAVPALAIAASGRYTGATIVRWDNREPLTASAVDDRLVIFLAGRAAEDIIHGAPSASAGGSPDSDLAKATLLAEAAETSLGLGTTGLAWNDVHHGRTSRALAATRPDTMAVVNRRLEDAYARAKKLIIENRAMVERLAEALLARVVLAPEDVREIVEGDHDPGCTMGGA